MKIYFLLILLLFTCFSASSATELMRYDYSTDTMSYRLYRENKWEALYQEVNKAQKQEISFYFLELRGAFAAYYTKRYTEAVKYFRQAEKRKSGDYVVREYHYLAARWAEMELEKHRSYELLDDSIKNKYPTPECEKIEMISLSSGYNSNSDWEKLDNTSFDGDLNIYGERIRLKNLNFQEIYLSHHLTPAIRLSQSFQYLTLHKKQDFYYIDYSNLSQIDKSFDIQTTQWQYFANATFNLNDKLFINPAFSHIHYNADNVRSNYDSLTYQYTFSDMEIIGNQSLFALTMTYKQNKMSLSILSNYLVSDRFNRYQGGIETHYFLNRSHKQYIGAAWYIHNISTPDRVKNWQNVWRVKMGFQLNNNIWLEFNHSQGSHQRLALNNGQIVFNSLENIKMRSGADLSIPFWQDQLWLSFYYRYVKYTSNYVYADSETNFYENEFSHFNHSISGGLTWYF